MGPCGGATAHRKQNLREVVFVFVFVFVVLGDGTQGLPLAYAWQHSTTELLSN
jgi:hypothetical protein